MMNHSVMFTWSRQHPTHNTVRQDTRNCLSSADDETMTTLPQMMIPPSAPVVMDDQLYPLVKQLTDPESVRTLVLSNGELVVLR
jgi:hypothetical protein